MGIAVRRLHPLFAAELDGVDASQPLSAEARTVVADAFAEHAVVIFRDQALDDEGQVAFARQFGELENSTGMVLSQRRRLTTPGMVDVSNIADATGAVKARDDRGRLMSLANQLWHSDSSYRPVPGGYSMLFAHSIPDAGGDTEFCDLRAAYDDLPAETKAQIEDLAVVHDFAHSRAQLGFEDLSPEQRAAFPPVAHPLVSIHPVSGRRSLFIGSHAAGIVGWPTAEARLLLADLMMHAVQRRYVYTHVWRRADLVVWDNRSTLHRGRPFDETQPRDLRRVTTAAPVGDQARRPQSQSAK